MGSKVQVLVEPTSKRLQLLDPFAAWDGMNFHRIKIIN
jgi:aconitate hydratase